LEGEDAEAKVRIGSDTMTTFAVRKRKAHRAAKAELAGGWRMLIISPYRYNHYNGGGKDGWYLKFSTQPGWSRDIHVDLYWNAGYSKIWGGIDDFHFKIYGDSNRHTYCGGEPPSIPSDFIQQHNRLWNDDLPKLKKCVEVVCMEMDNDPVGQLLKRAKSVEEKNGG
jgi:hypothetical protein